MFRRSSTAVLGRDSDIQAHYKLCDEELGRGGIGYVVKASNVHTALKHAVKVVPKDKAAATGSGIEAFIHKSLDHPNIVRLFETFEDATNQYLVMEICSGGTLTERCRSWCLFSEVDAAILMQQILSALRYIHKCEVLHGDVIPENVLLMNDNTPKDNFLKLCDFGCAKKSLTSVSDMMGCGGVMRFLLGSIRSCTVRQPSSHDVTATSVCSNGTNGRPIHVSGLAQRLLDHLLEASPEEAISAGVALGHPWIRKYAQDNRSVQLPPSFVEKLKAYSSKCRFKQHACVVAARGLGWGFEKDAARLFLKMSIQSSGFVTPYDLKKDLQRSKLQVPTCITKLMQVADVDDVGVLDYCTFLAIMLDEEMYKQEYVRRLCFSAFDRNGVGRVAHEEIASVLWGKHADGKQIKGPVELVQDSDSNGDGIITFDQFSYMMCNVVHRSSKHRQAEKEAMAAVVPMAERRALVQSKYGALRDKNRRNRKINVTIKARRASTREKRHKASIAVGDKDLESLCDGESRDSEDEHESDADSSETPTPPVTARMDSDHEQECYSAGMETPPRSLLLNLEMFQSAGSNGQMPFVPLSRLPVWKAAQLIEKPSCIVPL